MLNLPEGNLYYFALLQRATDRQSGKIELSMKAEVSFNSSIQKWVYQLTRFNSQEKKKDGQCELW